MGASSLLRMHLSTARITYAELAPHLTCWLAHLGVWGNGSPFAHAPKRQSGGGPRGGLAFSLRRSCTQLRIRREACEVRPTGCSGFYWSSDGPRLLRIPRRRWNNGRSWRNSCGYRRQSFFALV